MLITVHEQFLDTPKGNSMNLFKCLGQVIRVTVASHQNVVETNSNFTSFDYLLILHWTNFEWKKPTNNNKKNS